MPPEMPVTDPGAPELELDAAVELERVPEELEVVEVVDVELDPELLETVDGRSPPEPVAALVACSFTDPHEATKGRSDRPNNAVDRFILAVS